jgi:hypothetical protein
MPSVRPTDSASAALACSRAAIASTILASTGMVGGSKPSDGAFAAIE